MAKDRSEVLFKRIVTPHGQGEEIIIQIKAENVDKAYEIFLKTKEEMGVK